MTIPQRLKAWREQPRPPSGTGLSQKAAAELVGASAPAWSDWENGHKIPGLEYATKLDQVVGIPVLELAEFANARRKQRSDAKKAQAKRAARKAG